MCAISSIGSNVPKTVVPAVTPTKNTLTPRSLQSKIFASTFSADIRPLKIFSKLICLVNLYK